MYLQVQMGKNGTKNIFSEKQTTDKVSLMCLDFKLLTER